MASTSAPIRIDASALRRQLFDVLRNLDINGPVEILRNGHVVATLTLPPASAAPGATTKPHIDPRRLERICKKYRIKKLSLFGSVVRDDFGPDSDVDVLYEPEPRSARTKTMDWFMAASDALADLFGRRVDFVARTLVANSKNKHRSQSILEDERVIYENGHAHLTGVLA